MKVLLTHPGTQYAPLLAAQLHQQGILHQFVTGVAFGEDKKLNTFFYRKIAADRRRVCIPSSKLTSLKRHDLMSIYLKKRGWHNDDIYFHTNAWFEKRIPSKWIAESDVVIGFDTSSRYLVDRVHALNKPYILDVSIAHPLYKEKVFDTIRQRFPEWAKELKPKKQRNINAELLEIQKADYYVVATEFTKKTYIENGVDASKIFVNPYGTNLQYFQNKWHKAQPIPVDKKQKITFLFFGSLTARKGFPWLCKIWNEIQQQYPNAHLMAAGHGIIPSGFKVPDGITLLGSIHPNKRNELFAQADVFVFPSYFEGFAQVIIEAMACGLPVITTTHTVGPEIIQNGECGFVIEPNDDDALAHSIQYFLEKPTDIEIMGKKAYECVQPYTWDAYGKRWKTIIEKILNQ